MCLQLLAFRFRESLCFVWFTSESSTKLKLYSCVPSRFNFGFVSLCAL